MIEREHMRNDDGSGPEARLTVPEPVEGRASTRGERASSAAIAARIGVAVREARKALGISTRELAARVGTSQPFVSNIENGHLFPGVRTLRLLAQALEIDERQLLPHTDRFERAARHAPRAGSPSAGLLLGDADRAIAVHVVHLPPDEQEPRPHVHEGEELVLVTAGVLDVLRESAAPARLQVGDTLWLAGGVPHRLATPPDAAPLNSAVITIHADRGADQAHT